MNLTCRSLLTRFDFCEVTWVCEVLLRKCAACVMWLRFLRWFVNTDRFDLYLYFWFFFERYWKILIELKDIDCYLTVANCKRSSNTYEYTSTSNCELLLAQRQRTCFLLIGGKYSRLGIILHFKIWQNIV